VNVYDLLRRLMPGPAWQDYEVAEALELIAELERANVFGTTARALTEQHEHDWQELRFPGGSSYNWQTRNYTYAPDTIVMRCKICGKDQT
jgi:hypothetical protein